MKKVMDGNMACANIAYLFSENSFIYPITPSSPMASTVDKLAVEGHRNIFNDVPKVIEMQSEAGAAGAMHGALLAGSLTTTFTSSQGLLLMIPNMYKMAGEKLPAVIHVAARTVATHALSIFGDHSDIYATRQTGFCILASTNVRDAANLAAVAHLSAIDGSLPFLHFFDGFRTSHELNKVDVIKEEDLLKLVPYDKINAFRKRSLNVGTGIQKGMAENEDIYFQSVEARNQDYDKIPDIVNHYMQCINESMGTNYQPFNYYGSSNAKRVVVAMGSVCDTIKLVVEDLNKKGVEVGLVEVHLYRPFSNKFLKSVLPDSVEKIAVLDRTREFGSGEPLYLDIVEALKDTDIEIVGGRYGLSSKNTNPSQIKSVFEMLNGELKNSFTIGIKDDVTNLSLPDTDYELELGTKDLRIVGFGSDGMVSASKEILEILGIENYVQGYFEYDSKKSGGITIGHLRYGDKEINAPFYENAPDMVAITKDTYLLKFDFLQGIKKKGILVINTGKTAEELNDFLPNNVKELLNNQEINLYLIDAEKLALDAGIKGKISKIMEVVVLNLLNVQNCTETVKEKIREKFESKGSEIVNANYKALDLAMRSLQKCEYTFTKTEENEQLENSIYSYIDKRNGAELTVSNLRPFADGTFPCGLSKNEKRKISTSVAKWLPENCIQCGQCSIICPHAVIRPFITEDKGIPLLGQDGKKYIVSISEADCTGCTLCEKICPGKNGMKAITFGNYDDLKQKEADELFNNHKNEKLMDKFTIKGSQFEKPLFEFSGACAGCGETAYIKLLTQLYGNELIIANATGCSSIYGGSVPSTPYSIPWANSLFEDNAEFGYGMNQAYLNIRERIEDIMCHSLEAVDSDIKELLEMWLANKNDFEITSKVKEALKDKEIPNELKKLIDYIPSRSVWLIGGDGWAYDIGFSGIDHVLSSGEDVNILVLDTEVYSNTGGQMSKSSKTGAVAEFANNGKKNSKKDLFKIAMCYPNTYVATVSIGANPYQTIKALKEAKEHDGPSIIIAYCPCVEHGIQGGLACSIDNQKEKVASGYNLLMRFKDDKLIMDCQEPNFDNYIDVLKKETRYRALEIKNQSLAKELFEQNKEQAIKRYKYFAKIAKENTVD